MGLESDIEIRLLGLPELLRPVGGVVFWPLPYRIGPGETSRLTPYAILPPGPGRYEGLATLQGPGFTAASSTRFEIEVLPWDR